MFALKCLYFIALDSVDRAAFNTVFYRHYAGRDATPPALHRDAQHVFHTYLLPKTFPGARQHIAELKAAQWHVVLITGSLDHLMQPLATHLGADAVIAASLEVGPDGRFTGALQGPPVVAAEKVARMQQHAQQLGVGLHDCIAYSDSVSDLPMLQAVGRAVAVRADGRLRTVAMDNGWEVVDTWQ